MIPLAIVVPSFNRPDLLCRCLTSVTRHSPSGTDVLVVDDASVGGCISDVVRAFPSVRGLRLAKRGGFCVAANRGIAAVSTPIVELLNDDTEVEPGWADAALARFADPTVVAVAPLVLRRDGSPIPLIDSAGDEYHLGGFARKRGSGERIDRFALAPGSVFGASASSAFYRRDALLKVGAFPESFGSYFEDVDLSWRLRRAGGQIAFEPTSVVWHRVGASHGRPGRRLIERQSRNEERVFWRNVPLTARSLVLHAAVLLAKAGRRAGEGRLLPWTMGRLRALVELPTLLAQRRRP